MTEEDKPVPPEDEPEEAPDEPEQPDIEQPVTDPVEE